MTHELVKNHSNKIVNVGRNEEKKISVIAKIIMNIMGIDPKKLQTFNGPKGSASRRCPDTSLVKRLTKFDNYTPLEIGLRNTIDSIL